MFVSADSLLADYPTDQQLLVAAGMLKNDWMPVGIRTGLEIKDLERIRVDNSHQSQENAALQMLYKARESNTLKSHAQLLQVLKDCGGSLRQAAWSLAKEWGIPCTPD